MLLQRLEEALATMNVNVEFRRLPGTPTDGVSDTGRVDALSFPLPGTPLDRPGGPTVRIGRRLDKNKPIEGSATSVVYLRCGESLGADETLPLIQGGAPHPRGGLIVANAGGGTVEKKEDTARRRGAAVGLIVGLPQEGLTTRVSGVEETANLDRRKPDTVEAEPGTKIDGLETERNRSTRGHALTLGGVVQEAARDTIESGVLLGPTQSHVGLKREEGTLQFIRPQRMK